MKKIVLVSISFILLLVGCGTSGGVSNNKTENEKKVEEKQVDLKSMDAEAIINSLKDCGFPIDNIIVYNEENDVNNLLGRPNQYTSKINFADTRVQQTDDADNPVGGTIEVFNNNKNALARQKFIEDKCELYSLSKQYYYIYDNILFRLDYELTPSQANVYDNAMKQMQNGDKPVYSE